MITITRTTTGLLIQRDELDILIDAPAVAVALGPVLLTLIDTGKAIGQARQQGYNDGLTVGHANGARETRQQIERERETLTEAAALLAVRTAFAA